MGKYEPLSRHLAARGDDTWTATFAEVERTLGFELPRSARAHRAWWSNQVNGNHSQTAGWQEAGWETRDVDLRRGTVRFERRRRSSGSKPPLGPDAVPAKRDLWQQARAMSGIEDREALIEAALLALIQREAGRRLIALGGTMPDAWAPPRERPFA